MVRTIYDRPKICILYMSVISSEYVELLHIYIIKIMIITMDGVGKHNNVLS